MYIKYKIIAHYVWQITQLWPLSTPRTSRLNLCDIKVPQMHVMCGGMRRLWRNGRTGFCLCSLAFSSGGQGNPLSRRWYRRLWRANPVTKHAVLFYFIMRNVMSWTELCRLWYDNLSNSCRRMATTPKFWTWHCYAKTWPFNKTVFFYIFFCSSKNMWWYGFERGIGFCKGNN